MGRAGEEPRPVPLLPVQEFAGRQQGAGDDVPARYVARAANDPEAAAAAAPVPIIDIGRLCQQPGSESAACANTVDVAKLFSDVQKYSDFRL